MEELQKAMMIDESTGQVVEVTLYWVYGEATAGQAEGWELLKGKDFTSGGGPAI